MLERSRKSRILATDALSATKLLTGSLVTDVSAASKVKNERSDRKTYW
jgi:hypothetical protein